MNVSNQYPTKLEAHIKGETIEELFKNSLSTMNSVLLNLKTDGMTHSDCSLRIICKSDDRSNLLIDFLTKVLRISYKQNTIFSYVYFIKIEPKKLEVLLNGNWYGRLDKYIKGIEYLYGSFDKNDNDLWESHIVFEI